MSGPCSQQDEAVLVPPGWLADRLGAPDISLVDASWHMPGSGRDAQAEFAQAHIPGAVFLDIDTVCDGASTLPHMLPAPGDFAQAAGALGISNRDQVIVYDTAGLLSAARVWWMFRAMGHDRVAVLDGGLPGWQRAGGRLEAGAATPRPARFEAAPNAALAAGVADVLAALETGARPVIDARPAARFSGAAPEPRPGLRRGHMPGAINLPFSELLAADGTLLPPPALEAIFRTRGIDLSRPAITTCGSGVTAAIPALALARVGAPAASLYDGAWAEWGARADLPATCD